MFCLIFAGWVGLQDKPIGFGWVWKNRLVLRVQLMIVFAFQMILWQFLRSNPSNQSKHQKKYLTPGLRGVWRLYRGHFHALLRFVMVLFMVAFKFDLSATWVQSNRGIYVSWWSYRGAPGSDQFVPFSSTFGIVRKVWVTFVRAEGPSGDGLLQDILRESGDTASFQIQVEGMFGF